MSGQIIQNHQHNSLLQLINDPLLDSAFLRPLLFICTYLQVVICLNRYTACSSISWPLYILEEIKQESLALASMARDDPPASSMAAGMRGKVGSEFET